MKIDDAVKRAEELAKADGAAWSLYFVKACIQLEHEAAEAITKKLAKPTQPDDAALAKATMEADILMQKRAERCVL